LPLVVVVAVVVENDEGAVCKVGCRLRETVGYGDLGGGPWRDGRAEVAEGALLEDVAAEEERGGAEDDYGDLLALLSMIVVASSGVVVSRHVAKKGRTAGCRHTNAGRDGDGHLARGEEHSRVVVV
jgi:hypothetical protein